jgi:L-asparagine transporter-like permease
MSDKERILQIPENMRSLIRSLASWLNAFGLLIVIWSIFAFLNAVLSKELYTTMKVATLIVAVIVFAVGAFFSQAAQNARKALASEKEFVIFFEKFIRYLKNAFMIAVIAILFYVILYFITYIASRS